MQSLEAACEEGEHTFKKAKISRSSLPAPRPQESEQTEALTTKKTFCIHTKLKELHIEECTKDYNQSSSGLKRNSLLLEKLVAQERLNTVILNLYPGNKGYSLAFRSTPRSESPEMGLSVFDDTANMLETRQWPYEEDEMLRCIDNEELPSFFIDLFDANFSFLFYSGCIIAEVRDYRQSYPHFKCDIHHVLLKPTLQTILSDIHSITEDKVDWGTDEKQQLESQLLIAKHPTLCLDANPLVGEIQCKLNHTRQLLNTHRLRRYARKFSQVTVNRKRKLDQFTHRPGLELYDYITRLRSRSKSSSVPLSSVNSKIAKKVHDDIRPIPVPNLDVPLLNPPSQGVLINEFKAYERPKETSDCLPQLIEEYVLETDMPSKEKGKSRVYHIKLSILQRPSNSEYLGELYLDRDHKKGERNGVACRFSLGTRAHANRYIQQFTEIFTEGGRKSVRIKYGLSQGYRERIALAQAQAQMQSQHTVQVNLPQQQLTHLGQNLQSPPCVMPLVNGTVGSGVTLVQQNQNVQNSSVPILTQVQTGQTKLTSSEIEINALATKLMNSAQQFQAAANAKQQQQQQQQQKLASVTNNAAIINLLNSSPASNVNSDASAAVVNAINNTTSVSLLPHQMQTINQKLIGRKMTLSNVPNARVLNNSNLITVNNNNNRMTLSDLSSHLTPVTQAHTVTLTTANTNFVQTNYSNVPIKTVVNQRVLTPNTNDNKSALSALLVGTPAADRPDIVGPNTSSLLLEKLAGSSATTPVPTPSPTNFIQSPKTQYTVQSPKSVISPLSSPPPQSTGTINVQGLNFTPIQNISGLQNVQLQLPGFSQPISLPLNVSSAGTIQGHPTSIIVSLPVTTATATATSITQQAATTLVTSVTSPTVVLTNAGAGNLAQLVTSSVKGLSQQSLRAAGPAGVTLSQGGQFQLLTPVQRPRMQQSGIQQSIARGVQRTPITIKMAIPNATAAQVTLPPNSSMSSLSNQQLQFTLQKQAQLQQYQQLCLNQQQKNITQNITAKVRRRSNASDPQP
ncbi:transcription factor SPT20 homolog isoform X2 [Photinus pyralis]|uniref:transcription factor SPT20 homolog isoform X2 n=1 Tax=Photinus pyralis TaxID=7054 RepID=UPI0012672D7A|nr:transcription factor SPT20 homolog isoform X2 [Photinus pyralis]